LYASFSVAFERAAAADVALANAASKDIIDRVPFEAVWSKWGNESYFAWPPVIVMDPYSGSTIGNSWPVPVKTWKIQNGVDATRFDLRGGGYRAGAGRVPAVPARFCDAPGAVLPGVNIPGGDIAFAQFDKEPPKPLPAADPRACCAHCVDSFPVCAAWTHVAGKGCYIKKAAPGRANAALDHASFAVDQFQLDQAGQELDMVLPFGCTLARELAIFPQEGRQLQRLQMMGEQDLRGLGHCTASDSRDM
jgi:hypothetical protein